MPTRLADAATFGLSDINYCVSEDTYAAMPASARRRSSMLVHGVDLQMIRRHTERRAAMRYMSDDLLGGTVANLGLQKNYPLPMDAAARVTKRASGSTSSQGGRGPLLANWMRCWKRSEQGIASGSSGRFRMCPMS